MILILWKGNYWTAIKEEVMRYTEYHSGKAVIKDKQLLSAAMGKLAIHEDTPTSYFAPLIYIQF